MTLIIALLATPLALVTLCFALEIFVGLKPLRRATVAARKCRAVIVVPAHDEEAVLPRTLGHLKDAAGGHGILIVADNCRDRTAEIARDFGVDVIERSDHTRRGKGFALDYARAYLEGDPPEVVAIIDADCAIDAQSVSTLVQACADWQVPCQATNLQRPALRGSLKVQLSTFAFFIKNVVRERALQRLAGRVHLLGTGMALPWGIFAAADLATGHIAEDVKLGIELSAVGHHPRLVEAAAVWSNAESDVNTLSQRTRWEGGFLANALKTGPRSLAQSIRRFDLRSMWAAIDLMIPPVALLILADGIVFVFTAFLTWLFKLPEWPLALLSLSLLAAACGLTLAWRAGGSRFISLSSLLSAPLYIAWKLPMYLRFARRGLPKEWRRTER